MKTKNLTLDNENLEKVTSIAIQNLITAKESVETLVEARRNNKLSSLRASNVAIEIADLIRVLSVYEKSVIN